jgi:hypothetical protein
VFFAATDDRVDFGRVFAAADLGFGVWGLFIAGTDCAAGFGIVFAAADLGFGVWVFDLTGCIISANVNLQDMISV